MGGLKSTLQRGAFRTASVFAAVSVLGAVVGLGVGRAGTRLGSAGTTTAEAITSSTTPPQSTTITSTTTESTTTSASTTTALSTTSPASRPAVCKNCTPAVDIGAVTRPLLGFGYGGRRLSNGGIELVAVIITGDDSPVISRFTIRLPGQLSRDLPAAKRHLIRVQSGHLKVTARTIIVTLPKAITDETVTIPAAALAGSLSAKRRLVVGLTFQVHQNRLSRSIGSEVAIG